jgi:hypothetical protein
MPLDTNRIDHAVLAVLARTLHDERHVWKSLDWTSLDRLHAKGLISNPHGKAKSGNSRLIWRKKFSRLICAHA